MFHPDSGHEFMSSGFDKTIQGTCHVTVYSLGLRILICVVMLFKNGDYYVIRYLLGIINLIACVAMLFKKEVTDYHVIAY